MGPPHGPPTAPPQPSAPSQSGWRPKIEDMYRRYNPAKLKEIDALLAKYAGKEAELYHALCEKYTPAPSANSGDAAFDALFHAPVQIPVASHPGTQPASDPRPALAKIDVNNDSDSESAYSFSSSEEEKRVSAAAAALKK